MKTLQKIYKETSKSKYDIPYIILLLLFELSLCILIVNKVPYTEIDWKAYMEQISIYYDTNEYNYVNIRGGTGPLVYPAGFLYLYLGIRYICNYFVGNDGIEEERIRIAQWIFVFFYLCTFGIISILYTKIARRLTSYNNNNNNKANIIWSWRIAITILTLSKRIHSIYILRLFNDGPTMLCTYISFYFFTKTSSNYLSKKMNYITGCIFYSYAVSIKMNVLLYAPGLLLILLQEFVIKDTILCLSICAIVQLIVGYPFLSKYPINYLKKAFEFDRAFFYKWTVNWKVSLCALYFIIFFVFIIISLFHFYISFYQKIYLYQKDYQYYYYCYMYYYLYYLQ